MSSYYSDEELYNNYTTNRITTVKQGTQSNPDCYCLVS